MIEPGLFVGTLRHRRVSPVPHAFTYGLFMVLVDIDRIPELMGRSWLTSLNRWNWASFDDRDHTGDPTRPLRERLALDAARHGLTLPSGPILLLTHLRYLGYGFNPVSFYYAFDGHGRLALVLAEVHNTFGGAHNYWLRPDGAGNVVRAGAVKAFYVSPFMPPDLDYRFTFALPTDRVVAHMVAGRKDGPALFDATLTLNRRAWTAGELRRLLLRYPAITAGVTAAIHLQALRLWWKGVPVVPRPTQTGENRKVDDLAMSRAQPVGVPDTENEPARVAVPHEVRERRT